MVTIRQSILDALRTRLATIPGWDVQLRAAENTTTGKVLAIITYFGEDKNPNDAPTGKYQPTLQVTVQIVCNDEDVEAGDADNPYRYLDRLVALAEKKIHAPDSWGLDPGFTKVEIVGHNVFDPGSEFSRAAVLRLVFQYRQSLEDPEVP